ncbi:hypothetical protein IBX65_00180 [Candidatus Aerophobetes bacterium]|nr:hypothetical protein [Candidatus Aerophobetes bacterium]
MFYIEELFSVSFEEEEKIKNNPVPYGKPCKTSVEKTRYVGIARIRGTEAQDYRLEQVTIIILPGKDEVTEEKKNRITVYTQALARKRYAKIVREDFIINIDPDISSLLHDVALWMPFKFMFQRVEEAIEDMLSL